MLAACGKLCYNVGPSGWQLSGVGEPPEKAGWARGRVRTLALTTVGPCGLRSLGWRGQSCELRFQPSPSAEKPKCWSEDPAVIDEVWSPHHCTRLNTVIPLGPQNNLEQEGIVCPFYR